MRSDNSRLDISIQNPWWKDRGLWSDPDLARVRGSHLSYTPQVVTAAECGTDGIITLRGPRRAGKTVAIKLLIASLIEHEGWAPDGILWLTAETMRTMAQLEDTLRQIIGTHTPKLLCIDEITAVPGWQRVIKKLRDTGMLTGTCVILTGSSAHDLKSGAERMAGRRGLIAHPDRILLPMDFSTFCQQVRRLAPSLTDAELQYDYLVCGGFPFRVEAYLMSRREGRPFDPLAGVQIIDDIVFYEIGRRRLDRNIALEVIGRLSVIGSSAASYEGFAKALTVTRDTARKYLDAFGDAFLLATFSSYDTGRGRVAPKKDRKFAWVDPALAYLPVWLAQGTALDEPARAEAVVGVELMRRHEVRLWEGLSAPRNVFTWKSSSGKEVDFLVIDRSRKLTLPVEVKYQESISDWDFQVMERAFGKGILVTKGMTKERPKARAIPLWAFLARNIESHG